MSKRCGVSHCQNNVIPSLHPHMCQDHAIMNSRGLLQQCKCGRKFDPTKCSKKAVSRGACSRACLERISSHENETSQYLLLDACRAETTEDILDVTGFWDEPTQPKSHNSGHEGKTSGFDGFDQFWDHGSHYEDSGAFGEGYQRDWRDVRSRHTYVHEEYYSHVGYPSHSSHGTYASHPSYGSVQVVPQVVKKPIGIDDDGTKMHEKMFGGGFDIRGIPYEPYIDGVLQECNVGVCKNKSFIGRLCHDHYEDIYIRKGLCIWCTKHDRSNDLCICKYCEQYFLMKYKKYIF